jgi:general secretion pathway protein K
MIRRILKALARPILYAHRRQVSNRQAGFAMVLVIVTVAILGAVAGEFGYNARVEFESAANARDQVRAEYLARSGINLSRLLIKVQQAVLDPLRSSPLKLDIQIADFAPFLMQAFGGSDGAETLGGLLGISAGQIKGLGVGKGASFDVQMGTEDGKINVNCAGGIPNLSGAPALSQAQQGQGVNGQAVNANGLAGANGAQPVITNRPQALYVMLTALMFSPRYNRLFDNPDADGQYATRDLVSRALIDWSDIDETQFDPTGASGNPEDYRYDALRDPYKSHNNYYDTADEMQLVKGVGDDFWGSFGEMLTVYGGCKVNLNAVKAENWPVTAAIIRAAAKDPNNPVLMDDMMLSALAQQIGGMGQMLGGIQNIGDFASASKNGGVLPPPPGLSSMLGGSSSSSSSTSLIPPIPGAQPVELDPARLGQIATVGPRIVYRIDSTGTIDRTGNNKNGKKVSVHIRAIFDTSHFNQNTTSTDRNDRMGTWVYWRME